jgi:phosphoglycolate phosphatase
MTRLAVFDLDGTLIDSRRDIADATNALIVEYGGAPLSVDEVTAMVGEGAARLVRKALRAAGLHGVPPEALERFLELYTERLTVHTRPYAGIPEALATLRDGGWRLAVLTNKPQGATDAILEPLGLLPFFPLAVGGDTAVGRKPDPAGLQRIMKEMDAAPASTVMIGDSPIDHETASRAGTRVCLARYGFGFSFEEGSLRGDELFVDEPADLPRVLGAV